MPLICYQLKLVSSKYLSMKGTYKTIYMSDTAWRLDGWNERKMDGITMVKVDSQAERTHQLIENLAHVLREVRERILSLAMLPPAKLPTSSLVYHNHGLLASPLADIDTFPDAMFFAWRRLRSLHYLSGYSSWAVRSQRGPMWEILTIK